jgi:hypothetical protein
VKKQGRCITVHIRYIQWVPGRPLSRGQRRFPWFILLLDEA